MFSFTVLRLLEHKFTNEALQRAMMVLQRMRDIVCHRRLAARMPRVRDKLSENRFRERFD